MKLLKEGKFGKYLLYACGEVLLVVVGILIALQANNADQERQIKSIEHRHYQTLRNQLLNDRGVLEGEIQETKIRIDAYRAGMNLIAENNREDLSSLAKSVQLLIEYGDFRRKSNLYQTLISTGEITYLKNHHIVQNLQELERAYEITERLEATQAELVMTHTAPAVMLALDFEAGEFIAPELAYTLVFKNRFYIAIHLANEKNREFDQALSVIEDTLNAIDLELEGK
jgi:hypothetical protein